MDDFEKLRPTDHMLRWLDDEPYGAIRSTIEGMLDRQVPGSRVAELRVLTEPDWLTGARRPGAPDGPALLVRAGVAFEFALRVESRGTVHPLMGVFTWVGIHLDRPGQQQLRAWLDLDGTLATFGSDGELRSRVYFEASG